MTAVGAHEINKSMQDAAGISASSVARWRAWILGVVTCAVHAMLPAHALAQPVSGSLSVSATILPPITTPAVKPLSFRVQRDGVARLETTSPFAGAVSAIVMSTVASSANGFKPVSQRPMLVSATHASELREATAGSIAPGRSPWQYEVPLDASPGGAEPHDVMVRITYLIVPGT